MWSWDCLIVCALAASGANSTLLSATHKSKITRSMRSKLSAMRPALPWAFSCSNALTRSTVE